jgi:predicted small metal-binding protein
VRTKGGFMTRVMADCRRWPSDLNCSLTIIGEEEEVVRAAAEHAASVHGHEDTPEMRQQLREFLEPAEAYTHELRTQEPLPG